VIHQAPEAVAPATARPVALAAALGLAGALCLRLTIAGPAGAGSATAGAAFAAALILVAAALGAGWCRPTPTGVARGLVGMAVLCLGPLASRLMHGFHPPPVGFLRWAVVVVAVAVAEELLLRGVLFSALLTAYGAATAVAVTATLFALLHVPLYGWDVVALDLLVGVWLGLLRLWDGTVTAPAVAHAGADLAGWWLR
jgi:membrane protease YdiL (CAAX protease family)